MNPIWDVTFYPQIIRENQPFEEFYWSCVVMQVEDVKQRIFHREQSRRINDFNWKEQRER